MTTMTNRQSIHSNISVHNNNGTAYLEAGELSLALGFFHRALEEAMALLQGDDDTDVAVTGYAPTSPPQMPLGTIQAQQQAIEGHENTSSPPPLASAQFAFTQGINIIPTASAYSGDSLTAAAMVATIVLYNLALVYHVKGLRGMDSSSELSLSKARQLYLKASLLLEDAGIMANHESTGHAVMDLVCMSIWNNLGQSSYQLSDYKASQTYFDQLIQFCISVNPIVQHPQDPGTVRLLDYHKSVFLINAMTLRQPPKHAPAA